MYIKEISSQQIRKRNMSFIVLILLAVGLAMDAFAVSTTSGITIKNIKIKHALIIGLFFGVF